MLLARGWIPLVLGMLGAAGALAFAQTQTPMYEGLTRVRLELSRPSDFAQTQATKELLASNVEDLRTHDMAAATEARLGRDWLADHGLEEGALHELLDRGRIGASADINVYELQVKVRHSDPAVAEAVSLQWAETYVDRRRKANLQLQLEERVQPVIRDDSSHQQVAPRRKLLTALGVVAGLALGTVIMLLLEYVEQAVLRGRRETELDLGLSVLGEIPPRPGRPRGPGAIRRSLADLWPAVTSVARAALWPLSLALLGAVAAYGFSRAQTPHYRARARVALEPAIGSNWGNAMAVRETMRGFKEDIRTYRMAREVNERLQLDLREADLLESRRLNVAEDTGLFELRIDVFHSDQELARAIARTWAEVFIEQHRVADLVRDQRDRTVVRLRDSAIPIMLWSPKPLVNALAGASLGLVTGLALLWIKRRLKDGLVLGLADAAEAAGAPVLGSIPPA
ncbi:MAG: hypothetical protein ACH37Z_08915 [Anaerolineae bacterium]